MKLPEQWKNEVKWVCNVHRVSRFYNEIIRNLEGLPFIQYHEVQPITRRMLETMLRLEHESKILHVKSQPRPVFQAAKPVQAQQINEPRQNPNINIEPTTVPHFVKITKNTSQTAAKNEETTTTTPSIIKDVTESINKLEDLIQTKKNKKRGRPRKIK
jgi:hypothetical protein